MRDAGRRWGTGPAGMLLALLSACGASPQPVRLAGPTMGTTYDIRIALLPDGTDRAAVEQVVTESLREADEHLSGWNDQSELARFNAQSGTDWRPVSPLLLEAIVQAQAVSRASGGMFDVTVRPLARAWGFGAGAARGPGAPAADELARLRASVGHEKLESRVAPPALRKLAPELEVDLDGIAPGWAVDRIAARLEALGIRDYILELGGEVRARGVSPAGRRWRVAVEAPGTAQRQAFTVIELDGRAVSTSGDYRDFREFEGRRISHTIDPRTGAPVTHGLASVTVVHESAAEADAWATALMVLGPEEGMVLARRERLAALFIERVPSDGGFVEADTPEFERLRVRGSAGL